MISSNIKKIRFRLKVIYIYLYKASENKPIISKKKLEIWSNILKAITVRNQVHYKRNICRRFSSSKT